MIIKDTPTGYRGQNDLMAPWHKCRITDSSNFIPKSIFLISLNVNLGIFSGKCILNEKKTYALSHSVLLRFFIGKKFNKIRDNALVIHI